MKLDALQEVVDHLKKNYDSILTIYDMMSFLQVSYKVLYSEYIRGKLIMWHDDDEGWLILMADFVDYLSRNYNLGDNMCQ
jgi:hypothetical protein